MLQKKKYLYLALGVFSILCLVQGLFLFLQNEEAVSVEKNIQALLRQEITISNLFLISRTVNDLHDEGLIRCATMQSENEKLPYLDLRFRDHCGGSGWLLNGKKVETRFKSLNGESWTIEFQAVNGTFFLVSLWLARILGVVLVAGGVLWHFRRQERAEKEIQFQTTQKEKFKKMVDIQANEIASIKFEKEKQTILAELSTQVAHDIRSPLAALDMAMRKVDQLEEETRLLARGAVARIRDIANDLLNRNKNLEEGLKAESPSVQLISSIVEAIVTEKRMQFRAEERVDIEAKVTDAFGLFAIFSPKELKRVISNLVNNAVEALPQRFGKVEVTILERDNLIRIEIRDTGKGIPADLLARLGERGLSHGKENSESGSGLGLYHAKKSVESWSGHLEIQSVEGKGTTISIILPKAEPPDWFLSRLMITPETKIIVVDDDISVHQIWDGRFSALGKRNILHFSSMEKAESWWDVEKENIGKAQFLVDYEFLGEKGNGLDFIWKLDIANQAALVTSRFDEPELRSRAEKLAIKILPKGLSPLVPIVIAPL